jgi:hypothetical protein
MSLKDYRSQLAEVTDEQLRHEFMRLIAQEGRQHFMRLIAEEKYKRYVDTNNHCTCAGPRRKLTRAPTFKSSLSLTIG